MASKERDQITTWLFRIVVVISFVVFAYALLVAAITVFRSTPEIALYIHGGFGMFIGFSGAVFFSTWVLGPSSPSLWTDPAIPSAILAAIGAVFSFFGLWWYWDLGVKCSNNTEEPIEEPMCTEGFNGGIFVVWSFAASYILFFLFALCATLLSIFDLYYRRLSSSVSGAAGAARKGLGKIEQLGQFAKGQLKGTTPVSSGNKLGNDFQTQARAAVQMANFNKKNLQEMQRLLADEGLESKGGTKSSKKHRRRRKKRSG